MLASISSRQVAEWLAFFELEPYGPQRIDIGFGLVLAEVVGAFKTKGKSPKPSDWYPHLSELEKQQSVEEMQAVFRQVFAQFNAQQEKRKRREQIRKEKKK